MKKTQQPNITKRSCKEYIDDFKEGSIWAETRKIKKKKKNHMLNDLLSDKGGNMTER